MEQLVARRAHNPKVTGSSPVPATLKEDASVSFFVLNYLGIWRAHIRRGRHKIASCSSHKKTLLRIVLGYFVMVNTFEPSLVQTSWFKDLLFTSEATGFCLEGRFFQVTEAMEGNYRLQRLPTSETGIHGS